MKMKNKKAAQLENKKKHLEARKLVKEKRRGGQVLERQKPERTPKPTLLIACEGENTEPSYFRQFRLSSATIKVIGEGYNTISLVSRTSQLAKEREYDQVWCVFDKDEFPDEHFNRAIAMGETQSFGVAYSNQAFEYWIILHFEDHQGGAMSRDDYIPKINEYLAPLGLEYDKDQKIIKPEIFSILKDSDENGRNRTEMAILRAKRIYDQLDHASPAKEESSTTVFRLVEEMIKYI